MSLPDQSLCLYAGGAQNWTHFDRGIPRYVVEHLRALHALAPEAFHSVVLNPRLPLTGNLSWLLGTGLLRWNHDEHGRRGQRRSSPAIYHVMSAFEPNAPIDIMWPRWARRRQVSTVVTVYDLIPLIFSDHYLRDPRGRAEYLTRADFIRHADGVLAISQTTADDVVARLGVAADRVHVVHAGATDIFGGMYPSRDAAWAHVAAHLTAVRDGFLLYVGGFEFRKNLETLIRGYATVAPAVRRAHQLVIACRMLPDQMEMLRQLASDAGLARDELVLTGYLSDEDLGALYHACTLFVFPSLYEGSGLPMLEAMACGAPVAASETSTGPEILGDREATFDPRSPTAIARCLEDVLTSPATLERLAQRSQRRVRDYTWSRVAEESLVAYERLSRGRSPRRAQRPRLALVTPWPPEHSGIAEYNLRLARELCRRADVDVVVRGTLSEYPVPLEDGVRLIPAEDFQRVRTLRQPDRIIHCMGNSSFHGYVYELLRRYGGSVVLHDVRLTGFYGWLGGSQRPTDPAGWLADEIAVAYGSRVPSEAIRSASPDWQLQLALGIYMTQEVQKFGTRCFVHSRLARDVLELERRPTDRQVPISVLPFGFPDAASAPRCFEATTEPLIVSLGYVSEVKGIATLVTAFARLADVMPGARLVLAGPIDEGEPDRWHRYVRERAPGANIEVAGRVGDARYRDLLQRADLAVQLRLISNGEASAAIADCIAAGVPTIVTALGWASELPDAVVAKLPAGVAAAQLADQLGVLIGDPGRRNAMSRSALEYARQYSFSAVADAYLDALDLE